jgi:hypothetical protein
VTLEEIGDLESQRTNHVLCIAPSEALEQGVALTIDAHAQTRVAIAAPFAVARDRTADKPSGVDLADLFRALQDAVHRSHRWVLVKVLPGVRHRLAPGLSSPDGVLGRTLHVGGEAPPVYPDGPAYLGRFDFASRD